jgi:uncharacterized protein (TIGR00661 family)
LKIFYAIQATGNGHIARAIELMPYLQRYGEVDVFLSGSNSNLKCDLPVKYVSKGLSLFYGNRGGLDYYKMWRGLNVKRIWKEARVLPVENYDVVINDFESITSLACKLKRVASICFGHQAGFQSSNTPRPPKKELIGEFILKNYATATAYVGLHFKQYDDFIFNPVIKEDILKAEPKNNGHITVYLSHYSDEVLATYLKQLPEIKFEIFSKKIKSTTIDHNITFIPINNKGFTESLTNCEGIITGAGFETPAEALYLGKKLLCLPIKGQYEQLCNAAALKNFGVPVIDSLNDSFTVQIIDWLGGTPPQKLQVTHSTNEVVAIAMETAEKLRNKNAPVEETFSLQML